MKTLDKFLMISAMAFLFMLMAPHKSMAQDDGYVSDQEFYDDLQDYGTWVYDEQYGNVWVPDVDGDFRPYATDGYWVQTDYGTTWVSDYPWGWATFHYGRWRYDDYYGWEWIPGHEWAPAWVSWRQGGGYYSWAPMQPGITISISLGGGYYVPDRYWVCAPQAYITSRYINRYYVPNTRSVTIIHNTTYIHNTYIYNNRTYITGPRPHDIERVTHRPVTVYKVNNAGRPGAASFGDRAINIYRPVILKSTNAGPVRVVNAQAYRQTHPNDGIGRVGVTVNSHANAAKLSAVAHSNRPDNRVVHVNPAPANKTASGASIPAGTTHPAMPGGHKNVGPVVQNPQPVVPTAAAAKAHNVAPAVMPPADHHDPTVRHPASNPDAAVQQQAQQARQQAQQAAQQQKMQQQQQQAQARQQAQQQAQQAVQQQKAQQQQQQAQARQQAQQQAQQAAQQQKVQQQQQQAQARQQAQQQAEAQQAVQQQKMQQQQQAQARQQAQQKAQQAAQQQKMQQQQQQAQARQQAQQQKMQQQQQQAQARQQAQQQQKMQQQQQQAAQRAAREAAQRQQQEDQKKQQTPPGN